MSKRTKKKRVWRRTVCILLLLIAGGVFFVFGVNAWNITITLKGAETVALKYGERYEEEGAEAYFHGSLIFKKGWPVEVVVDNDIDWSQKGKKEISYSAKCFGLESATKRTVFIEDTVAPELILLGEEKIYLNPGEKYIESGFTANDNYDGDITSEVKVDGTVNIYLSGEYPLRYTVADSSGNVAEVSRTVIVQSIPQPEIVKPEGKVIYLTFDDGPGKYTQRLLEILNQYEVKATFFTVSNAYSNLMAQEAATGHTVAIHSATHKFSEIYANEGQYFADLQRQQDLIFSQTGKKTTLVRFPGGSSNKVSIPYNEGIMTRLAKALDCMGYQYFDWNVDSNDAGGASTVEEIAQNVIDGVQKQDISIVLMHDVRDISVEAVEQIIVWGLANGYQFLPLEASSPAVHHTIKN